MRVFVLTSYGEGVTLVVGVFATLDKVMDAVKKTKRYSEFKEYEVDDICNDSVRLDKKTRRLDD